jgi:MFS family permease
MFIGCMLVTDPTKGNVKLAEIQEQMDKEELAEVQEGKSKDELPTMGWKRAFIHPAFWFFFISLVFVQLFGNVLVTDVPYIAETVFGIGNDESAWAISLFSITAGVGGIVIGFMSDKIGPYKSTMILGIADGILILLLVFAGHDSWMFFVIICAIQGFTYNGMTTLNPVMIMDSYSDKDFGVVMGGMAVAYTIVGVVGPQIGLELPFLPLIIVSGVLSIIGGIFAKFSAKSLNKYYEKTGSACRVR